MSVPAVPPADAPREDVNRGTAFALIVIPVGIVVWLVLWNFGFIASIVSWGVAWAAGYLYHVGARRITSTAGVPRIIAIVIVTIVVSLIAGFAWDVLKGYEQQGGIEWSAAIAMPQFWSDTFAWMFNSSNALQLIAAVAFAALGCFSTLRGIARTAKTAEAQAAQLAAQQPAQVPMDDADPHA